MESIHINTDVRFSQRFLKQDLLHFYPKGSESACITGNAIKDSVLEILSFFKLVPGHSASGSLPYISYRF